ncbi:MAG TPA: STN domain-containing protein, partial [Anaeromyxobacteraceae bacterium]
MLVTFLLALGLAAPPGPRPPPLPPRATAVESHRLGDWPARPSGKTVTLADEVVTLDDALQRIAGAAGWNLVASTGTAGDRELRLALRGVPVEEALEAVLEGTPLAATRRGSTVTVAPGRAAAAERPVLGGFEQPTGKRFSGDFTDAPVARALTEVTDAAGLSLVLPSGLRGAVSGHFRGAP